MLPRRRRVPALHSVESGQCILPQIEALLLQAGHHALAPRSWASSAWALPPHACMLTSACWERLEKMPTAERDRLRLALINILTAKIGPEKAFAAGNYIVRVAELAQSMPLLIDAHWGWNVSSVLLDVQPASVRRILQWVGRRLLLDAWLAEDTAIEWAQGCAINEAGVSEARFRTLLPVIAHALLAATSGNAATETTCRRFLANFPSPGQPASNVLETSDAQVSLAASS